jgi:hypothetical protein
MNAYGAYATVAACGAIASLLVGWGSIKTLGVITDSAMWAIATMAFAPALMAVGVSLFICLTQRSEPPRERRPPPDDPFDVGAFTSKDR